MPLFKKEKNKKINDFEIAMRMRDFEIGQLTNRNNFFMIFQGVLFAGMLQSDHTIPIISFMACVVVLVVSLFQVGVASGAKFWQEYWEQMLSEYEKGMRNGHPVLFHEDSCKYSKTVKDRLQKRGIFGLVSKLIMSRFSVSRIPIYVGIGLSIIWGLLLLSTLRAYPPLSTPSCIIGF
ncbi:MAG: hypothetical protein K2Q13_08295 [Nitrosomonas sp.]|uniref:RipA family octameric membrane protein n=1 Tax=Nitrosomonas sp. TaxID=42353 RepID=UPI0025DA3F97|nr:hypothetical protein [Nitrosomonas sp.]MBY0475045.1 hypothetical protein [Nitrosomonas sp.]